MKKGRYSVFTFAMTILGSIFLLEKLDIVIDSLKRAANLNVAFGFAMKNVEDWNCQFY